MKKEDFVRPTAVTNDLTIFKPLKGATNPNERVNEIRLGIRKTIEFLNQPHVKYVLEKRGVNVNEKLAQLRGRFTVLAKFPAPSENELHLPPGNTPLTQLAVLKDNDGFNTLIESEPANYVSEENI